MALKDQANQLECDITYASGDTLDTQGYMSATFVLATINTTSVALEESDNGTAWTDVAEEKIIKSDGVAGAVSGNDVTYTAAGTAVIGCVSKKRYMQATITNPATDTTIVTVLGNPLKAPIN